MQRIDHLLFRADADFIAYFDAQPLPGCDMGIEPCGCFALFVADKIKSNQSVSAVFGAIENIMQDGGWNAEQLSISFFPTLSNALHSTEDIARAESFMGRQSLETWHHLITSKSNRVI